MITRIAQRPTASWLRQPVEQRSITACQFPLQLLTSCRQNHQLMEIRSNLRAVFEGFSMTPKICGIASLLSLMFSFTASGQETHRLTIPELVSRHGPEPISLGRVRELLPEDFDELVSTSDLIIEGRIERSVTYLSDDQRDLFTDYFLSPQRVVIGSGIVASSVPGEVAPIVVKRWGGE